MTYQSYGLPAILFINFIKTKKTAIMSRDRIDKLDSCLRSTVVRVVKSRSNEQNVGAVGWLMSYKHPPKCKGTDTLSWKDFGTSKGYFFKD